MKRYPPITKKEFVELCEISSGPIEVGSVVTARAEAEVFDSLKKKDRYNSLPPADKKLAIGKDLKQVAKVAINGRKASHSERTKPRLSKHLAQRTTAGEGATSKSERIPTRVRMTGGKKKNTAGEISPKKVLNYWQSFSL